MTGNTSETEAGVIARSAERVGVEFKALCARPLMPGLYLVATPIGNLGDITLRALNVLVRADRLYCEDTRHSRKLTEHYGIGTRLSAYHDHNADGMRPRILSELAEGLTVALISDAGTPLISDPGYKLGRAALDAGHKVVSLPGPTAPIVALTSSGLPTDNFQFLGFLPSKSGARRARIESVQNAECAVIFFEAPSRLSAALADLYDILGDRRAVVARELTKIHEEVKRGLLSVLLAWSQEKPVKGEIVIIIAPGGKREISDDEILTRLSHAIHPQSLKDASREIANELEIPRKRVYELGLTQLDKK